MKIINASATIKFLLWPIHGSTELVFTSCLSRVGTLVNKLVKYTLLVDDKFAIRFPKNSKLHYQMNHINLKYHLIQYHVEANNVHLIHYSKNENLRSSSPRSLEGKKFKSLESCLDSQEPLLLKGIREALNT